MENRENDAYSEQDVNNVLLKWYEATHRKDSLCDENQVEFCKGWWWGIDHGQLYVLA